MLKVTDDEPKEENNNLKSINAKLQKSNGNFSTVKNESILTIHNFTQTLKIGQS